MQTENCEKEADAERQFLNVDDALQEYYYLTGDNLQLESLGPEPQLENDLDEQTLSALQTGELVIIGAGILISGYFAYKYL